MLMNVIIQMPADLELYVQMLLEEKNAPVRLDLKEILTPPDATMPTNARDLHRFVVETLFALTSKEDFVAHVLLASSEILQ